MAPKKRKNIIRFISVLFLAGSFLFIFSFPAQALYNSYDKAYNGTLTAEEWNYLDDDFLNKIGSANMEGPLNITGGGLTVNGVISATSFTGSMSARNISSGIFGAEQGEGNFSFPGYLGVGNTNPNYDLDVSGNINFTGTLYQNGDIFTSSKWSNNGLNIYFNTGNVGIGLTNPDTKLDVGGIIKGLNATFTGLAGSGMADDTGNLYSTSTDAILPEGTVSLPSGSSGSTLRHDGDAWISNTFLYNNGTAIGIGTTEPGSLLTVANNSWLSARNSADKTVVWSVF